MIIGTSVLIGYLGLYGLFIAGKHIQMPLVITVGPITLGLHINYGWADELASAFGRHEGLTSEELAERGVYGHDV